MSKRDAWRVINDLVKHCQVCIWDEQCVQIAVVVFEIQPILLSRPVDLIGGAHPVGQAISGSECFAWRTAPLAAVVEKIAVRMGLGKLDQFLDRFTFLVSCGMGAKNKVVSRVERPLLMIASVTVLQWDGRRLIKKL